MKPGLILRPTQNKTFPAFLPIGFSFHSFCQPFYVYQDRVSNNPQILLLICLVSKPPIFCSHLPTPISCYKTIPPHRSLNVVYSIRTMSSVNMKQ